MAQLKITQIKSTVAEKPHVRSTVKALGSSASAMS